MKKNEYIELARKELHHLKHKDLLKKAFRDGVYRSVETSGMYKYKEPLDSFLHTVGILLEKYPNYVEMLDRFLHATYLSGDQMEKEIFQIFLSIPLTEEGGKTFVSMFSERYYSRNHLFSEFYLFYKDSLIITEFFKLAMDLYGLFPQHYYSLDPLPIDPVRFLEQFHEYYADSYPDFSQWKIFEQSCRDILNKQFG